MITYRYYAIKKDGTRVEGQVEATTEREARNAVIQLGFLPTRIMLPDSKNEHDEQKKKELEERKKFAIKKLNMREKIDFTVTLQTLIKAGVPLIEALVFLESDTSSKRVAAISTELRRQIIAGNTFSAVVEKYPQIFDKLYTGLVKAGEEAGELDVTLERIAGLLKKQDDLKSKIIGVMAYPCIILFFAAVIVIVMLTFVFPKFSEMYGSMGAQLPWITQTCIDTGKFLAKYWLIIPVILGTLYYGPVLLFQWEPFKRRFDNFVLKIPLIRDFVKLAEFSNFVSVMLVAYEAGVPIVDCLFLASYTINNYVLQTAINNSRIKVQQGQNLSASLKSAAVMPPIILFMVSTGEQSGKLGDMLAKASEYIDNQLDRIIDMLTKFIEPIMLVFIGGVVLVLALALYLPLFQSYSQIGN